MYFKRRQALWIKIPFADGGLPEYKRPFLIVGVMPQKIKTLNVSSLEGKEVELLKSQNKLINNYRPPFYKPSFVKLDVVYVIEKNRKLKTCLMDNGKQLNKEEFEIIYKRLDKYKRENEFYFKRKEITKKVFYTYN